MAAERIEKGTLVRGVFADAGKRGKRGRAMTPPVHQPPPWRGKGEGERGKTGDRDEEEEHKPLLFLRKKGK